MIFVLCSPVIFEVPHFASLRGQEREIIILRSDNGRSWSEHTAPPFDDIEPTLQNALLTGRCRGNSSRFVSLFFSSLEICLFNQYAKILPSKEINFSN